MPACMPFFDVTDLPPSTLPVMPVPSLPETKPPLALLSVVRAVPDRFVVVTLSLAFAVTCPSPRSIPRVAVREEEEPSKFVFFTVSDCDAPLLLISFDRLLSAPALRPSRSSTSTDFFSSTETLPPSETLVFFSSPPRSLVLPSLTSFSWDCVLVYPSAPTFCWSRTFSVLALPPSKDVVVAVTSLLILPFL
jgi:hypothetical protein